MSINSFNLLCRFSLLVSSGMGKKCRKTLVNWNEEMMERALKLLKKGYS